MSGIGIDTFGVDSVANNISEEKNKNKNALNKDAFLQLLVTQMQYQDPLQPTTNTEYMSQLAQFSTVEELQNINTSFSTNQAMNLAGQYVILNVPDAAGNITQMSGLVDYVTLKDGKAFFHIQDQYYPAEYLDSIVSLDYLEHIVNGAQKPENEKPKEENPEQSDKNQPEEKPNNDVNQQI